MKIVNLTKFRAMPAGTLFMKYEPCVFEDLCAKEETLEHDFLYDNITYDVESTGSDDYSEQLLNAEEKGSSLLMNFNRTGRDGCFDESQLFAVYEGRDIDLLISKLEECRKAAY